MNWMLINRIWISWYEMMHASVNSFENSWIVEWKSIEC